MCTLNCYHVFRIVAIFYYIWHLVNFTRRHCKYLGANFQVISRKFISIIICNGFPGQDFLDVSEQCAWCTFNVIHNIPLQVPLQNQLASHVTTAGHVTSAVCHVIALHTQLGLWWLGRMHTDSPVGASEPSISRCISKIKSGLPEGSGSSILKRLVLLEKLENSEENEAWSKII